MNKAPQKVNAEFKIDVMEDPVAEAAVPVEAAATPTLGRSIEEIRRTRQPLNGRVLKLQVHGVIPGYRMYIAKDEGARIPLMQKAGYDFVKHDEVAVGGSVASYNTDPGGNIRFVLGANGSETLYGYLMKIPEEFYQEDQASLEAVNASVDDQIKHGALNEKPEDMRHVPKGRIVYDPGKANHFRPKP